MMKKTMDNGGEVSLCQCCLCEEGGQAPPRPALKKGIIVAAPF